MITKTIKPTYITTLLILSSLCVLACLSVHALSNRFKNVTSQAPIRSLIVAIDTEQREEFFNQLRKFAEKHAFEYNLTDYGGQGNHFLVELLGDDIKILVVRTSSDLNAFSIRFYAPSPGDPLPDEKFVEDLVVNLKNLLNEIPNVTINDEK